MDTSKEYINMSGQAIEIQELWEKKEIHIGDMIYINTLDEIMLISKEPIFHLCYCGDDKNREYVNFEQYSTLPIPFTKLDKDIFYKYDCGTLNIIWLLRQDQLQNIIGFSKYNYTADIQILKQFVKYSQTYTTPKLNFGSMEQLWLAFVMANKYNKTWNKKTWEVKQSCVR